MRFRTKTPNAIFSQIIHFRLKKPAKLHFFFGMCKNFCNFAPDFTFLCTVIRKMKNEN